MNHDVVAWLRLWQLRNVSYKQKRTLLVEFGSAEAIFAAPGTQVAELLGSSKAANAVAAQFNQDDIAPDLEWLQRDHCTLIPFADDAYPALLREIADPPLVLYVHGNSDLLRQNQLAIVGSRNPTPLGRETAFDFASTLAHRGFTVTSGMALGIDAAAHQGAISASGTTVAVAATGLDIVYPRTNQRLADNIVDTGVIISEFAIGTPPKRENFPRRNRIISGLAFGTLVVEAASRCGSLITARLAGEQGREVFAIPGSIHSPNSRGCHQLIKQGAKLVETIDDIMCEFEWLSPHTITLSEEKPPATDQATEKYSIEPSHKKLLELVDFAPTSVDSIIERSGLTAEAVSSILLQLELRGLVQTAPGGYYTRAA